MKPELTIDRLQKIANGIPGDRGIPVKKYVERDQDEGADYYAELLEHHKEETRILYDLLQEAAIRLVDISKYAEERAQDWRLKPEADVLTDIRGIIKGSRVANYEASNS